MGDSMISKKQFSEFILDELNKEQLAIMSDDNVREAYLQ